MDLPQQLEMMRQQTKELPGAMRIHGYGANLLDPEVPFPTGFDAIWMSQFLDCFSEEEVTSILTRAARSMSRESRLYIMETFWNRQKFDTAAYCLTQISLYFTAMANGNSKMYHSDDMERCIKAAGLEVEKIDDHLGMGAQHCTMQIEMNDGKLSVQGEGMLNLIPQRPPIVMVDSFFGIEENHSYSGLTVTADNIFCETGKLQEAGIIEHIAQSAAARIGFLYTRQGEKVPLGFIGSVDKLKIHDLPKNRDETIYGDYRCTRGIRHYIDFCTSESGRQADS